MIDRYSRPEMARIFADENRYRIWLEIEILSAEAWEKLGKVPRGTGKRLRKKAKPPTAAAVNAIENVVRHDVIAFLSAVKKTAGDDTRHLHFGMTSADLGDTACAVLLQEGGKGLMP